MTTFEQWSARGTRMESGGIGVATYDLGRGTALTFLHGYPSSSLDIEPVLDRLGSGFRLLTLDFPGFGASDKPHGHPYSIAACADAVEAMWRQSGVNETVVMSHDYGVSVGQELLARRTEASLAVDITATVWSNGGLYPDLHRPTIGQQMLLDPEHGAEVAAAMDESLFASGVRITWGERREMADAELHEMWLSFDHNGGSSIANELLHYIAERRTYATRWSTALETFDGPMHFVWGDLDPVSGAHMIVRVEERIPTATVERLADVGHWPTLEAPDEVAAAIRSS